MKEHQLKINSSFESEISSNSGLSSLEESTYDNRSFNDGIPKLQEIFKPRYYGAEDGNTLDAVCRDKIKYRYRKSADNNGITSSQESDFLGFSADKDTAPLRDNEMNYRKDKFSSNVISSSQESDFLGFTISKEKKGKSEIYTSSQESNFAGFSDIRTDNNTCGTVLQENKIAFEVLHYKNKSQNISSSSNKLPTQLEDKSLSKPIEGTSIFGMINTENSCNAVDIKLCNEGVRVASTTKLSFDGTIQTSHNSAKLINQPNKENSEMILDLEGESSQMYKYVNEKSPDLFDDEDDGSITDDATAKYFQENFNESTEGSSFVNDVSKRERELLKRIKKSLSGVPPPPSVTLVEMDMFNSVTKNKENIFKFFNNFESEKNRTGCEKEVIFKPTHSLEEVKLMKWPELLNVRGHGLCYNLSTVTEKVELLCLSVLERCVGSETCSSYQPLPSSAKKRNMRTKMLTQSPGSRLSHLAKRRAIFSSANLQSNSQLATTNKIGNKVILLDIKKSENRRKQKIITPKRRTPGTRKNVRKTPSSSAKKKLLFRTDQSNIVPSRETSKRALFQSPPQQQKITSKPIIKPEIANRVEKSKRALFSPEKPASISVYSTDHLPERNFGFNDENNSKRRREDDNIEGNSSKLIRIDSMSNYENLTPRSLKIKSQSFCVGSGTRGSVDTITGKSLFRTCSDTTFSSSQLSDSHKKKLLWAVSQALQSKQISVKHSNFKQYAFVLARVVKRLFLENCQKSGSTSDTMLRLAKKTVFWVMQGKTADDIYLQEKNRLQKEKMTTPKLIGYIGPEDFANRKVFAMKCSQSSVFSENSVDSFGLSQSFAVSQQSFGCANVTQYSQNSEFSCQISQDSLLTKETRSAGSAIKLPIQQSPSLQNSSSKNNLSGSALRENIDCELRRSAQKNFTGKDQKNLSPYSDKIRSSSKKYTSNIYETNPMKAKRQISFDS